MKLLDDLKRLLGVRPRPPVETPGEPTADRPPPEPRALEPRTVPPPVEPAAAPPMVPRPIEAESAPVEIDKIEAETEVVEPLAETALPVDDVAEVRAALDAISEPTRAEPPSAAEQTELDIPLPAPPPASPPAAAAPVSAPPGALVLTLATPAVAFTVAKTAATIGRGQENTIRLDELSVSRRHARIAYRQGGYWISDLGSMGGTWVDGTRISAPTKVASGQIIDIGLCRLTVGFAGGPDLADAKQSARPRSALAGSARRRR